MAKNLINSIYLSAILIVLLVSNGLPKAKGQCILEEGPESACPVPAVDLNCDSECKKINPTYTGKCELEFSGPGVHCHCYGPCPP
ncbi:unnamed protein product [Eruca vesicaria subsp. sativa]|uniref:Uncharacterized protein n=1 Tax=Eruca vesicaria subsp. sativa TaxID=29727 RepID=A0ABC8LHW8_ERUVS|nr:unnamed protein product [Eruca vesicaria subsp. sativa]